MGMLMGNKQGMRNPTEEGSNDGKFRVVCVQNGSSYLSSDYGVTWNVLPTINNGSVESWINISETGQYIVWSTSGAGKNYYSIDYGVSFTQYSTSSYPYSNMSDDASRIIFLYFQTKESTDYGVSFSTITNLPTIFFKSWKNSYTGQYAVLASGSSSGGWYTIDYGATWNVVAALSGKTVNACSVSGNGQYMVFGCNSSLLYLSNDYGSTFNTVAAGTRIWSGSGISYTGQYILALERVGQINISNDYGVSWTRVSLAGTTNNIWCEVSGDGKYMIVSGVNMGVYQSSDFGVTWVQSGSFSSTTYTGGCTMSRISLTI